MGVLARHYFLPFCHLNTLISSRFLRHFFLSLSLPFYSYLLVRQFSLQYFIPFCRWYFFSLCLLYFLVRCSLWHFTQSHGHSETIKSLSEGCRGGYSRLTIIYFYFIFFQPLSKTVYIYFSAYLEVASSHISPPSLAFLLTQARISSQAFGTFLSSTYQRHRISTRPCASPSLTRPDALTK